MRFSSFIYLVGQGLHNLRANRLMTFASMGVLTVCMLLIGAASLLGINIDHMVEYIGNQNETVVYMGGTGESEVATDEQIAAADAAIPYERLPLVQDAHLMDAILYSGVWAQFNKVYPPQDALAQNEGSPQSEPPRN